MDRPWYGARLSRDAGAGMSPAAVGHGPSVRAVCVPEGEQERVEATETDLDPVLEGLE
jgi:hypothetical protein